MNPKESIRMKQGELPTIVRVSIPQTRYNPDAVDADIYCVNTTSQSFSVAVRSQSFTTVDEADGLTVEHGSAPGQYFLSPGECVRMASVEGWEWDGHVGLEVTFKAGGSGAMIVRTYNLKEGGKEYLMATLNIRGRIISPEKRK
jgi:hypothetical protein